MAPSKTGVAIGLGSFGAVLVEDAVRGRPAEVRLEDLADVHPARHAERVEHDVDGRAVLEERHVLLGTIFEITPLLPWRPASLSPSLILRFFAT